MRSNRVVSEASHWDPVVVHTLRLTEVRKLIMFRAEELKLWEVEALLLYQAVREDVRAALEERARRKARENAGN